MLTHYLDTWSFYIPDRDSPRRTLRDNSPDHKAGWASNTPCSARAGPRLADATGRVKPSRGKT